MSGLAPTSSPRRILLCGYYGEHNLGDDALLEVLNKQLPKGWQPVITANDASAVQTIVPNGMVVNRRSLKTVLKSIKHVQVVVLGGGSLLQDSTSFRSLVYYIALIVVALVKRKPVLLWGQGLGPLRHAWSRYLVGQVLNGATSITWRDSASMQLAKRIGIKRSMSVAPDPVWSHQAKDYQGGGNIVLCWRPTSLLTPSGWSLLLQAVDELSETKQKSVTWFAFHANQDVNLLQTLSKKGLVPERLEARSSTIIANNIDHALEIFSNASLVIAMRLHALILSIVSHCPTAGLSYDPKVEAAARTAEAPWLDLVQLPSIERVLIQWSECMSHAPSKSHLISIQEQAYIHERTLKSSLEKL
ncbi:MAG: polysaccharide pyruvyl transferase CsaB [Synechococcus sp. ChSW.bin.154]|jgi:polysaccharide pyruvyl transferase CsaB